MKNKMVVANWKMNLNYKDGIHLLNDILINFNLRQRVKLLLQHHIFIYMKQLN